MNSKSVLRLAAMGVIAIGVLAVAFLSFQVLGPRTQIPDSTDAVLLFAGGDGERLPAAVDFAQDRNIDTLLISTGNSEWIGASAIREFCGSDPSDLDDLEVVCFEAVVDDTAGEASEFSMLAAERGYTSLVVASSDYHVSRASMRVRQCFEGEVGQLPIDSDSGLSRFGHEFFGLVESSLLDRACLG